MALRVALSKCPKRRMTRLHNAPDVIVIKIVEMMEHLRMQKGGDQVEDESVVEYVHSKSRGDINVLLIAAWI
jgi:hypothetical protein